MHELDDLLAGLALEPVAADEADATRRYRVETHSGGGGGPVFGGLLMAQSIVAASKLHDDKAVKTVHTIFARAGRPDEPLEIEVEEMHGGRTFASATVTIRQGERLCTRSLVLSSAEEPDFIDHAEPFPAVGAPEDAVPSAGLTSKTWEVRFVDDVDISDPEAVGPPDLDVWTRWVGAPDDPVLDQALLAYTTDGFLIGTAMRPHEGVGQSQAHVTLATGVVSHTLTFHRPAPAGEWLLLSHHSPSAGGGRSYGRADVFTAQGTHVASFVQDAMIRPMGG